MDRARLRRGCRLVTTVGMAMSLFEYLWVSKETMWRLQCSLMFAASSWLWVIEMPGIGFVPYPLLASLCTLCTPEGRTCWKKAVAIGMITDLSVMTCTILLSVPTALALFFWSWSVSEDHGIMQRLLGPLLTPLTIPLFGIGNALVEELEFRGLLLNALTVSLGTGYTHFHNVLPISIQAILFALQHFAGGFPNGIFGTTLVLLWGAALGFLAVFAQGILPGLLVHIVADLTIALLIRRTHLRLNEVNVDEDNNDDDGLFSSTSSFSSLVSGSYPQSSSHHLSSSSLTQRRQRGDTPSSRRHLSASSSSSGSSNNSTTNANIGGIRLRRRRLRIPSPTNSPSSPFFFNTSA